MNCRVFHAFATIAALAASSAALADTLPPPAFYGSICCAVAPDFSKSLTAAGGVTQSYCDPSSGGCFHQSITSSYAGGVLAITDSGTASGPLPPSMTSINDGVFYFEVQGPAGATASLAVSAAGSTSVTQPSGGNGWALVGMYVSEIGYGGTPVFSSCSVGAGASAAQADYDCGDRSRAASFAGTAYFTAPVGALEYVSITSGYNNNYGDGSFFAGIDPTITFAPGFNSDGLSIAVSPGVAGTVPEPSAWMMMLIGVGGLGASLRARRRAICAA